MSTSSEEKTSATSVDGLGGLETEYGAMDLEARQRAAVLAFGRRAGARPKQSILIIDAVTLLAGTFESDFNAVGEVAADGTTLMLKVAKTGKDGKPVDPVVHKLSMDAADSMAATALETAQPVVVGNLSDEKRFADRALRKLGVAGALTVPLHLDNKPFGTLGVYTANEQEFTKADVGFAETIAHLLANSVARAKVEEELQKHQRFASTVLESIDSFVVTIDAEFKLKSLNRTCQSATGFKIAKVAGKPFCNVFVVPEELELVQGAFRTIAAGKSPGQFESYMLTKDSDRRRVAWSMKVISDDEDGIRSIVLTGTDRTEQIEAELRAEKAETLAREAVKRLKELRQEMSEQGLGFARPIPAAEEASTEGASEARPEARGDASGETSGEAPTAKAGNAESKAASEALTKTRGGAANDAPSDTPSRDSSAADGDNLPPSKRKWDKDKPGAEARTSTRRTFHYKQLIAPMYGGSMPSRNKFFQVTCENISAGGFAFYLEHAPEFEYLVVALGQVPSLTYFSARVVRVMKKEVNGRELHLVGCRFSGRVHA